MNETDTLQAYIERWAESTQLQWGIEDAAAENREWDVEWRRKKLTGYITLKGRDLSDREVRTVVEMGIKKGYRTLYQIPDEEAKKWLNVKK